MPNTTNFNWPTPADTDLVKDGAAAIRNLGNGVDSSLVDLKGGTTGQILSKASNADMDFTFITPNVGDITEVQAGVGISITSGTGPIPVITNSSTDLITTAGDLLYGTAADTVARLGIGTAGQILKVNAGATAPEWGAAAGLTYIGVSVYKSAAQTIANNTDTALTFDSEFFDTDSFHDTVSNTSRLTIPAGKGGKYALTGLLSWNGSSAGTIRAIKIYKNGSILNQISQTNSTVDGAILPAAQVYNLVATDYLEIYVRQNTGGNLDVQGGTEKTSFQLSYLGA